MSLPHQPGDEGLTDSSVVLLLNKPTFECLNAFGSEEHSQCQTPLLLSSIYISVTCLTLELFEFATPAIITNFSNIK